MGRGETGEESSAEGRVLKHEWRSGVRDVDPASMCAEGKQNGQGQVFEVTDSVVEHGADRCP